MSLGNCYQCHKPENRIYRVAGDQGPFSGLENWGGAERVTQYSLSILVSGDTRKYQFTCGNDVNTRDGL